MEVLGPLEALSISSLASDHEDGDVESLVMGDHSNIHQTSRMSHTVEPSLIDKTFRMQSSSQIAISRDKNSYLNVECGGEGISIGFDILSVGADDVLTIFVECLRTYVDDEELSSCIRRGRRPGIGFYPLQFQLRRATGGSLQLRPHLFNGTYVISLSTSSGLRPGAFVLDISCSDNDISDEFSFFDADNLPSSRYQGVCVKWNLTPMVQAMSLPNHKSVRGYVGGNEFAYYRFVLSDIEKMVSIRVTPLKAEMVSDNGELEVFVTDYHEGLLPVTKDNYIWRSFDSSPSIDILPDDPHFCCDSNSLITARYFVIGVFGVQDSNHFEIQVSADRVPSVTSLSSIGNPSYHIYSLRSAYGLTNHFCVDLNPTESHLIALTWSLENEHSRTDSPRFHNIAQFMSHHNILADGSDGVYVSENIYPIGLEVGDKSNPVPAQSEIIVYISATARFPDHTNYTWKAFGSHRAAVVLDCTAWKYLSSQCYISVYSNKYSTWESSRLCKDFLHEGVDPSALYLGSSIASNVVDDEAGTETADVTLSYSMWTVKKLVSLGGAHHGRSARQDLWENLFAGFNAASLSHKDRSALGDSLTILNNSVSAIDEQSLAYGEIVSVEDFSRFLSECGAIDGQIFYDLGAGCGKAVVAAALSGICFLKCCGIELLPGLAEAGATIVGSLVDGEDSRNFAGNSHQRYVSTPIIEMRKDNFLESDWSDGDTVFCASTCFSDRLLDELFEVAEKLKCGSRLITSRVPSSYDSSQWAIEKNARCEMSWGRTEFTVFVRL